MESEKIRLLKINFITNSRRRHLSIYLLSLSYYLQFKSRDLAYIYQSDLDFCRAKQFNLFHYFFNLIISHFFPI